MDNEWNKKYTENSLIEELALLERHYRDGSYKVCTCVPEKHLPLIAGLSSEMVMFVKGEDKLIKFYSALADIARTARTAIEDGNYDHGFLMQENLIELVGEDPKLQHQIQQCVKKLEKKVCSNGVCTIDPQASCEATVIGH